MSSKKTNLLEKEEILKQMSKFNEANDSISKTSDNSTKNIFLNSTPKTSSKESPPKSSMPDEKLFETFVMFQNFMKMMNYSSNHINPVLSTIDNIPNLNLNLEDAIDVMPELKEKIKYTNSNDIALSSNLYEAAVEETCVYLKEGKTSAKCSEVSNIHMLEDSNEEQSASGAHKPNKTRKQTNNLESPVVKNFSSSAGMSAVNMRNFDDIPIKTVSNNFIEIFEKNLENAVYDAVDEKSLNKNEPGRKVKRAQPKKNMEVVKKADPKIIIQNDKMKSKSPIEKNLQGIKEEKKQIKRISTKINLKKNYINSQKVKDKIKEDGTKTSEIDTPLKINEKLEIECTTDIKTNSHIKILSRSNNTSTSNVEKSQLKSYSHLDNSVNSNNNIFINGESSLKKLQKSIKDNKNSSQEKHSQNAEDEEEKQKKIYTNEKEAPRDNASERYSKYSEINTNGEIRHKTPEKDFSAENYYSMTQENLTQKQKVDFNNENYKIHNFSIGFKINEKPSENKVKTNMKEEIYVECDEKQEDRCNYTQTKQIRSDDKIKGEIKEDLCEELEDEESELAIYEYANEEDISRKSIENVDNSNLDNSNQFDIPLIAESNLGPEYKDLLSSRVIEMNNELIKLKGENEKVSKMKSEYQKLTRKLKLELQEFNERREKELKKLKLETEEFEEKKERELKSLKFEYEEFYERKEKDIREMEEKKEDEMKKIIREKKSLERNMKLNLSIGNRKDKDEIESLKTQISKLGDDNKFKDNTNKLLIDRLRKQLEEANLKIGQLSKANDELKSSQLVNKKRTNVSSSSNIRVNKSETKTLNTLKKTSSVKELPSRNNENKDTKPIKQNGVAQIYKTELPKKKILNLAEELQNDSSNYDLVFPEKYHPKSDSSANKILKTDKTGDGKIIKIYEDGRREIIFPSGVRKEIQLDGYQIVYFTNKDIKQTFPDGKSVYYFSEAKTTQTNILNGLQVFKFENGQTEKHNPDGSKQITFPDGTMRYILEDGYEETLYPDGSVQKIDRNGVTTIEHDDGTREIKYPDGREVMEYAEGRTKRKYSDMSN